MRPCLLVALALTLTIPGDGHGQSRYGPDRNPARTGAKAPSWLECFSPNECEVRVFVSAFHGRKGRLRLLAARAASACQAAGYSHYVASAPSTVDAGLGRAGDRFVQRLYFTHDSSPPARPCSFSATAELEAEAKEMARVEGYPWPVGQDPEGTERWTFEPGENDWGEAVPELDAIASPFVPALRSDQQDLVGLLVMTRDCTASLGVIRLGAEPGARWAYAEGGFDSSDSALRDRIVEIRVDGTTVQEQGQNVTRLTAGIVVSSKETIGVGVRSAEHEDNAAFAWPVMHADRAIIRKHFPNCVGSP